MFRLASKSWTCGVIREVYRPRMETWRNTTLKEERKSRGKEEPIKDLKKHSVRYENRESNSKENRKEVFWSVKCCQIQLRK